MRVVVNYLAQLKQAAGTSSEQVEISAPCLVREFLVGLAQRRGARFRNLLLATDGGVQPTVLIFVDDEHIGPGGSTVLHDGAVVTLLSPIAGG
jgi:molybdopterin converting factor small subunit